MTTFFGTPDDILSLEEAPRGLIQDSVLVKPWQVTLLLLSVFVQ